jgi:hypothetical protein
MIHIRHARPARHDHHDIETTGMNNVHPRILRSKAFRVGEKRLAEGRSD